MSSFALREARASDSRALAELAAGSADTGQVAFSPRYRLPVVDVVRAKHPGAVGVVAEAAGHPGLVGAGWISPGTCRLGERTVPSALLHALTVHPSWRRRGIATALTAWRLARAAEQFGEETLVYAGIQEGNAASLANARRWARQVTGRLVVAPVPMRRRPPTRRPGVTVRAMRADEADVLAGVLAEQYRDCELAPCDDAGQIRAWLARSPAGTPLNEYVVAVDDTGRWLAGAGVEAEAQLLTLHVERMSWAVERVNALVKLVPADREMRNVNVRAPWYLPGHREAGEYLWQTLRWSCRDRGSSLVTTLDARSPLRRMLRSPRWLPTTTLQVAVRSAQPLDDGRLLGPGL